MEFETIITRRRAINFFDSSKQVSEDLILKMVNMASLTPSGYNLQPWSLIILSDPNEKASLRKLAFDQPKITDAPYVFIVLADRDAWKEGHFYAEKNFQEMVKTGSKKDADHDSLFQVWKTLYGETTEKQQAFANKNAGFFAMSLMYSAVSLGLDTHPMDGFDHDEVKKAFNIPDNYWIPLLLAVGYFDESMRLNAPKWRKSPDELIVSFHDHRP